MSATRHYDSPRRQAQAAATRTSIVEAFVEQLSEPGRDTLSPSDVAKRAGVSTRTVHAYFPNAESQIEAVGAWCDQQFYGSGVEVAHGPDDLPRYFREIHASVLATPHTRVLALTLLKWPELRQKRRAVRLDAIRRSVAAIGAPARATEDATAMLLGLSGLDASWPLHELYGLPIDRIPDVIANTVRLIVDQLRTQVVEPTGQRRTPAIKPSTRTDPT